MPEPTARPPHDELHARLAQRTEAAEADQRHVLDDLRKQARAVASHTRKLQAATDARDLDIASADLLGVPQQLIADLAGVSRSRVAQIAAARRDELKEPR